MPTANVVGTYSGTSFTIDVTACNLDPNPAITDYVVLHNGVVVANNNGYTKTTQTILTYSGASLPSTQVTVLRSTPVSQLQPISYGARFSSALWNSELDRNVRWKEEAQLNGKGPNSTIIVPLPRNDPFGSVWSGDTTYPPNRAVLYNWGTTLAPLASPQFSGVPTVPTPVSATDRSTTIANTTWVQTFVSNAVSTSPVISNPTINGGTVTGTVSGNPTFNGSPVFTANPTFSGSPTTTYPPTGDYTANIANTKWVYDTVYTYLTSSPTTTGVPFKGTPQNVSLAVSDSTANLATTSWVASLLNAPPSNYYFHGSTGMNAVGSGDASTLLATTAWVQKFATFGAGYLQFGSSLLIQWGVSNQTTDVNSKGTITFPRGFTAAPYCIIPSLANNAQLTSVAVQASSTTSTSFVYQLAGAYGNTAVSIGWIAIGPGTSV